MSKRTRLLLRENNALESELSREEDREVLTDITVYLRTANISQYYQERVRRDICRCSSTGRGAARRPGSSGRGSQGVLRQCGSGAAAA